VPALRARWEDPHFQRHFPWFASERYWQTSYCTRAKQRAALDETATQDCSDAADLIAAYKGLSMAPHSQSAL